MKKPPFHLVILGPQGSGKGTQVHFLSSKFKMPYFSAGELIRKKAEEKSKTGKMVREIHDKGMLIPHKLTKRLIKEALSKVPLDQPVIFEGYPRAEEQYFDFLDILKERKLKQKRTIVLKIKDETVYKRLSGRRYCTSCEKNYNPPKSLSFKNCSACGGRLARRPDDTKEAIFKRLNTYKKETKKALSYFKEKGELIEIDGESSIEEVSRQVMRKIEEAAR